MAGGRAAVVAARQQRLRDCLLQEEQHRSHFALLQVSPQLHATPYLFPVPKSHTMDWILANVSGAGDSTRRLCLSQFISLAE